MFIHANYFFCDNSAPSLPATENIFAVKKYHEKSHFIQQQKLETRTESRN